LTRADLCAIISADDILHTDIDREEACQLSRSARVQRLLPLTPSALHILLSLADGEQHGYAIMKQVEADTDGQIAMGPGTLYGTIKRLLAQELIRESANRPDPQMDDQRRRYYALTGLGRQVLQAEAERLAELVRLAERKHILAGGALSTSLGDA